MSAQPDWASILRRASESLAKEGRHNQASILKDAASAFDELKARLAQLERQLKAACEELE